MKNSIINYFLNGFSLANKSLDIFLISVLFLLISFIPTFLKDSFISNVLLFANFLILLIDFGFTMSIPLFLLEKQQNKKRNYSNMWSIVLQNTKRIILPGILIVFLMMILGFGLLVIVAVQSGGDVKQVQSSIQNFTNYFQSWNPIHLALSILFSLFIFTPLYFSIEKIGIFSSIKRSVVFSFKNLNFILLVIIINAISYSITTLIPYSAVNNLGLIARLLIGSYVGFVITASSLLYYQSKKPSK